MRPRGEAGATLLETVVVLAIVATAATVAATLALRPGGPSRVETTALEIAGLLRTVRSEATRTGTRRSVRFDLAAGTWGADQGARAKVLPRGIALDVTTAAAGTEGTEGARLTFEADGSSAGARIVVREAGPAGARRARIDVDWLTGRVSLVRSGGG